MYGMFNQNIEVEKIELTKEELKISQYAKLESTFSLLERKVRSFAIDKPYFKTENGIKAQENTYKELLRNAEAGLYDEETCKVIIEKNKISRDSVAEILKAINDIKAVLADKIEKGLDITTDLKIYSSYPIDKKSVTKTAVTKFRKQFGI